MNEDLMKRINDFHNEHNELQRLLSTLSNEAKEKHHKLIESLQQTKEETNLENWFTTKYRKIEGGEISLKRLYKGYQEYIGFNNLSKQEKREHCQKYLKQLLLDHPFFKDLIRERGVLYNKKRYTSFTINGYE